MEDLEDDDNLTVEEKRTKFFNSNKILFTATDRQVNIAYNQLVQRDITSQTKSLAMKGLEAVQSTTAAIFKSQIDEEESEEEDSTLPNADKDAKAKEARLKKAKE